MATIRPYREDDLPALYDICLRTGDSGQDASHLYDDPRIIGEIYAAPYGVLQPDLAFVAEDDQGVAAYALGTPDTRAFEARQEAEWWPRLRTVHPEPPGPPSRAWTRDHWRAFQIHHPFTVPQAVVEAAPAHLHINLLPRLQGQDVGRALIATLLTALGERGTRHVHLGCDTANHRALRFYDIYGFQRFEVGRNTVWMTLDIV
ncbi:GNAT family N-acetyltransferase [Phenylobacterium sp. LH3H17]|uniref:GNAT family N-acetyltransferase n=1 Tax=Phenylobacterium sp. LH3H17 TaxID=2903901 RepID=UPI0020C958F2|nr:GNAT family N-acetyltransferase [Phenylobacterium sp. LH3H17]UTP38981.1 GNAT family N-acetyltransferase [Phenylobacterium sp. LH3H17]